MTDHPNSSAESCDLKPLAELYVLMDTLEALRGEKDVLRISGKVGDPQDVGIAGVETTLRTIKGAVKLLERMRDVAQPEQERVAELQYEAGMYQSLYENAIERCAALMQRWSDEAAEFINSDRCAIQANVCRNAAVAIRNLASQPSPAATVEVPPDVMERRRKGLSDYERPPLGQPPSWLQEQEKIATPHNGSSAATVETTTKSAPALTAPHNSGERAPSSDAARVGADTNSSAGIAHERVAGGIVRAREFFERNPSLKESVCQIPACGLVTYGDLAALREYADIAFEAGFPNEPQAVSVRDEMIEHQARFLLDRLQEFDPGDFQAERDFHGHVAPAISRLKSALAMSRPQCGPSPSAPDVSTPAQRPRE